MNEPIISAHAVQHVYQRKTVLNQISLDVPEGAVLGLVGRNGAGKSTLLRNLVGLTVPDKGFCKLDGCLSTDLSDSVRERLGYVAQTPDLFDWLTGDAHFERIGSLYARWDQAHAYALAAQLDLPLHTKAKDLSLGDQQKLSVVLALGHDPDILILDEPVASLDPMTRRAFMRALFEQRGSESPRTVIISSHLLTDLERVVTHVAFMREGRIQLMDEWDALTEHLRLVQVKGAETPLGGIFQSRQPEHGRWLVDTRLPGAPFDGRALNLDDLFLELNA
ncbi:ABC transporter ATP-binding protein [Limnohabitans sp. Rim8]|uniref:ABC transporter ATP-binding protein n=1 Tax=Limnohabitans sp. Rim8 TaxID=1100718 RepID=UPI0025DA28F5|nr:ABC transporter ATP-binding protein [Limnohabitans sp. Rim8]